MSNQRKYIKLDDQFCNTVLSDHYEESGFNLYAGIAPPVFGQHTEFAFNALKRNKIADLGELKNQLGKAYEIFTCCTPAFAKNDRQGLAIGKVQSGKTASQALITSLAADNGTKVIIHVLGTTSNLKSSNYDDLELNLGLRPELHEGNLSYGTYEIGSGKNKYGLEVSVESLAKKIHHQRKRSAWGATKQEVIYLYLLKQHQQIAKVKNLMEDLHRELPNQTITTLIIDDEVDAYTPNTNGKGLKPSTTYDEIKSLKDACKQHTYVGYTATSQAIWCAHDSSFLRPDFHAVLDAGSGYVGNEQLFGESRKVQSKIKRKIKNQTHQPVVIDVMSPGLTPGGKPKMEMDLQKMKKTLEVAAAEFLIAACFLLERRINDATKKGFDEEKTEVKPISMMCLPHLQKKYHSETVDWLNGFLRQVKSNITNPGSTTKYVKLLQSAHDKHMTNSLNFEPQPSIKKCFALLTDLFQSKGWEIKEINGSRGKIPSVDWGDNKVWFCVGGIGLSRGFVVDGLITTWMPAEAGSIVLDVIEQRGRFFGYKKEYQDLISIHLQEKSKNTFQDYSSFEKGLFNELKDTAIEGKSLKQCDPSFEKFDFINKLTASNKDWNDRLKTYSGNWFHTFYSPFDELNGACAHSQQYNDFVKHLLGVLNLKYANKNILDIMRVNPNPNLNKGQKFKSGKFSMDKFYPFLEKLEPLLDTRDAGLKSLIKSIKANYLGKNFDCYVTIFNQKSRQLDEIGSGPSGPYHFPILGGYSSGRSSNKDKYVGDDSVIFGDNLDPDNFDEDANDSFNIQFHNFSEIYTSKHHSLNPQALVLNDITAMRIKTPWSKTRKVISNG